MYATLFDKAHPLTGTAGGGGGGPFSIGPFTSDLYYNEPLPKGPLTVTVTSISAQFPGHWEAAWTPPQTQTLSTPQLSACLTRESWGQALQAHASLPAGLSGTLALAELPPDYYYHVSIAKLDGSGSKSLGPGSAPSLSSQGTRVVHIGPVVNSPADGLYITDLASGNTTLLPGTTRGDMNPLCSPDGQTIAFTRGPSSGLIGAPGPYNVMLTNADGTNARQLTEGMVANYAQAWMPDGNWVIASVHDPNASNQPATLALIGVDSCQIVPVPNLSGYVTSWLP
jgi:hypothetical protein